MPKPRRQRPRDSKTASPGRPAPAVTDGAAAESAPHVPAELQPRGPNREMSGLLRQITGRPEFNVANIEKTVAGRLAERKTSK